jgi:hypothetical protein
MTLSNYTLILLLMLQIITIDQYPIIIHDAWYFVL